jgi:hypothetical protein
MSYDSRMSTQLKLPRTLRVQDASAERPPLTELEEIANTTAYLKRRQQKRKGAKA